MAGPVSPAAERNREPILDILRSEYRERRSVLEIGSGTGQHALYFAAGMPWLTWHTSDLRGNHAGINAWIDSGSIVNVVRPFELDVLHPGKLEQRFDAVFSANTAHIMSVCAVQAMFCIVGRVLNQRSPFCLYGPFNQNGKFSSDSNCRFDQSLRSQNSDMGIRDLQQLDTFAESASLVRTRLHSMPANNKIAVWIKSVHEHV